MSLIIPFNTYISSDGGGSRNSISRCFEGLKNNEWMKKNSKSIKLIKTILMHVVFNLILSAVDVGSDIYAATNHFR